MELSASSRLLHHPLFAGLPLATVERVSLDAHNVAFDPGQVILAEGSPASTLYLLQHGKVALSAHAPGKGHVLVQTLGPGEVLGLSWLFPPYQWRFDAHAVAVCGGPRRRRHPSEGRGWKMTPCSGTR